MKINLFDDAFTHAHCSIGSKKPKIIEYVRNQTTWDGITLFTDNKIYDGTVDKVRCAKKVA